MSMYLQKTSKLSSLKVDHDIEMKETFETLSMVLKANTSENTW